MEKNTNRKKELIYNSIVETMKLLNDTDKIELRCKKIVLEN